METESAASKKKPPTGRRPRDNVTKKADPKRVAARPPPPVPLVNSASQDQDDFFCSNDELDLMSMMKAKLHFNPSQESKYLIYDVGSGGVEKSKSSSLKKKLILLLPLFPSGKTMSGTENLMFHHIKRAWKDQ